MRGGLPTGGGSQGDRFPAVSFLNLDRLHMVAQHFTAVMHMKALEDDKGTGKGTGSWHVFDTNRTTCNWGVFIKPEMGISRV